ncbi:MAG: hypothetical protein M5R42_02965 [Rhodocyclaceae bacterium]|nr:hypothetical protein [Rhodocyclaceae bacterium]
MAAFVVLIATLGGHTSVTNWHFLLGRWKGNALIERFPPAAKHKPRVLNYMNATHVSILTVISGLRIAGDCLSRFAVLK